VKKKPLSIKIIALGYLLAPLFNVTLTTWLNKWPLLGPRGIFQHFSTLDWIILLCFPLVGVGIFFVTRIGNIAFLIFSAFLIGHNSYNYIQNPVSSIYLVLLFNTAILGLVGFFLQKPVWQAYYQPSSRWWTHPTRYNSTLNATVSTRKILIDVKVTNISQSGCFIETYRNFNLLEEFEITLCDAGFEVSLKSKVVWKNKAPTSGYGLMFNKVTKMQNKKIKLLIKSLKKTSKDKSEKDKSDSSSDDQAA
jgi:Tfp pilus assembly protein PilZ